MNPTITIRTETQTDYPKTQAVVKKAFARVELSDQTEHLLVERLRQSSSFDPDLSLVAEMEGEIVGHILLSKVELLASARRLPALALAPVSVVPDQQGKGIGGALIREAHKRAEGTDHVAIVLLGHPDYYPRFGYAPAADFQVRFPFEAPPEACMILPLRPKKLGGESWSVLYPKEFFGT